MWTALMAICVFFIIHNAQWFIGDDAIVIRHTGFGKPFLPSDTVIPSIGRFFPFSYLAYDILLLFGSEYISPTAHYVLHAVFFVIFVVAVTILTLNILENSKAIWKYSIAFLVIVVFVSRVYPLYVECFSTAWFGYSILAVFMLCIMLFYKKQRWIYGVLALLCVNYSCYCGESAFVLPLSFGTCSLLFQRKTLTKKEKALNWCFVGSALLFLLLYAILILPQIETAYDSAHGEKFGFLENAIKMLWAQKILVLALVVLLVRVVDIIKNKKDCTIYDNLLFTAAACCCGNFVLRLNWSLYYNGSALLALPAILYFSNVYLKEKWTLALFVLLALFYGRKLPNIIKANQKHRSEVSEQIKVLSRRMDESVNVFWYAPISKDNSFELIMRNFRYESINVYLGWLRQDPGFSIKQVESFSPIDNSIWLTPKENKDMFPNDSCLIRNGELVFEADSIKGYEVKVWDY